MKKTEKKTKPVKKPKKKKIVTVGNLEIETKEEDNKKTDKYEEHGCDYLNEAECEEELEDDGLDVDEIERDHFEEEKE